MQHGRPRVAATARIAALLAAGVATAEPIDTIVAYAQKRASSLVDVAISVTTLSDKERVAAGIDDLDALAVHASGLDLQRSVGAATTTLRIHRIGTLGNTPTLEPAVGLFVDGAYGQRSFLVADLLDVDHVAHVEVLADRRARCMAGTSALASLRYTLASHRRSCRLGGK
jgi:iron complex outermembrane receptor protein